MTARSTSTSGIGDMAAETTVGVGAAIKYIGVPALLGALGAGLGFAVQWPKTAKEAASRFSVSILASFLLGPIAVIEAHRRWPELFHHAADLAQGAGLDRHYGHGVVAAPFFVLAALGTWHPLGWAWNWAEKRKDKDIVEVWKDR